MTDQREKISPRARLQTDQRETSSQQWRASNGARVLIRLPLLSTAGQVHGSPAPARTVARDGDTTRAQTGGSPAPGSLAAAAVPTPTLRVDAAHHELAGPHSAAPVWLDRQGGFVAGLMKRKSLMIAAVVLGATIGYIVHHSHIERARMSQRSPSPVSSAAHTERDRKLRHRATVSESGASTAESNVPTAEANTPASIDAPQPRARASAAANQPAGEMNDDLFQLQDSPTTAREPSTSDPDDPSAAVERGPSHEAVRTALRDVSTSATTPAGSHEVPPGVARFGGTLTRIQAPDSP